MGPLRVTVALTWIAFVILVYSQAAPVTEFFGPPQTIEGERNVDLDLSGNEEKKPPKRVQEMERFHRTYENGTVEFKMALSNGHVQYQRISPKIVGGSSVQVYEGYISEQYKDGRYGTRYYAADENGYRSSPVIVEDEPPQLPTSGPYSTSLNKNIQDNLSPPPSSSSNNDDNENGPKTITENLVNPEDSLQEEQLLKENEGSNAPNQPPIGINDSEIYDRVEINEISNTHSNEDPSETPNFNGLQTETEIPINLDQLSTTELRSTSISNVNIDEVKNDFESSTIPAVNDIATELTERNLHSEILFENVDDVKEVSEVTEQNFNGLPININQLSNTEITSSSISEENIGGASEEPVSSTISALGDTATESIPANTVGGEEIEESSGLPPLEEELSGRNFHSEILSESTDDVKEEPVAVTQSLQNSHEVPTELPIILDQLSSTKLSPSTSISEENIEGEVKNEIESSTTIPALEDIATEVSSSNPSNEPYTEVVKLEESSELPSIGEESSERSLHSDILSGNNEDVKVSYNEPIENVPTFEVRTEQAIDEIPKTTIGTFLNDAITPIEQSRSLNPEIQEANTEVPEISKDETSTTFEIPLEDDEANKSTTLLPSEVVSNTSEDTEVSKDHTEQEAVTESNSDATTSSLTPEIAVKNEQPEVAYVDVIPNSEVRTEKSLDEVFETTTVTFLNDEVTLGEEAISFNDVSEEPITVLPQLIETTTGDDISRISESESTTLPVIDVVSTSSEEATISPFEEPSTEVIGNSGTVEIDSNTVLPTSSFTSEIQNEDSTDTSISKVEEVEIEESTDLPLEDSVHDEKDSRSVDLSIIDNNSTSTTKEGITSENGQSSSTSFEASSIAPESNEETTKTIDLTSQNPESTEDDGILTTISVENINSDGTTEAAGITAKSLKMMFNLRQKNLHPQ